eukprot:TRINITY_DN103690_c0_g1_i1.p1 TRINITY_DN103690_c0_g1~~TRINITY_DN103690_c0_g1_i1.p1  ORF type:complete len:126 (-),score=12.70 TRINITY_DN103690_c0_g1_i1:156-533(-)
MAGRRWPPPPELRAVTNMFPGVSPQSTAVTGRDIYHDRLKAEENVNKRVERRIVKVPFANACDLVHAAPSTQTKFDNGMRVTMSLPSLGSKRLTHSMVIAKAEDDGKRLIKERCGRHPKHGLTLF